MHFEIRSIEETGRDDAPRRALRLSLWAAHTGLLLVLFLMGTQSAFFGPGKYGILPELFRREDLPRANGIILMTTFLAIILGMAVAGPPTRRRSLAGDGFFFFVPSWDSAVPDVSVCVLMTDPPAPILPVHRSRLILCGSWERG